MKSIIAAFQLAMTNLKAKADAALETIKSPIDQIASASEVVAAINTLKWCQENVTGWLTNVAALEAKFDEEVTSAVNAQMAAKVAAGEYMAKADVETAIAAAELKGKNDSDAAYVASAAAAKLVSDRRAEIATAHGAEAAAEIPEAFLKGDDAAFAALKTEFARRSTGLAALGVTAALEKTRPAFADIACGIEFSEAGNKAFDDRMTIIKSLVPEGSAPVAASAASGTLPGSGQPPAAGGASGGSPTAPAAKGNPPVGF
jgi:hypothetical protein